MKSRIVGLDTTLIRPSEMKSGEVGIVRFSDESPKCVGLIVLRIGPILVGLDSDEYWPYWAKMSVGLDPSFSIELLPSGTKIEITL